MKEIHITPVLNGFIVKVGCSTVVFNSIDLLCDELRRYQKNPGVVEEEYVLKSINPIQPPEPRVGIGTTTGIPMRVQDESSYAPFRGRVNP